MSGDEILINEEDAEDFTESNSAVKMEVDGNFEIPDLVCSGSLSRSSVASAGSEAISSVPRLTTAPNNANLVVLTSNTTSAEHCRSASATVSVSSIKQELVADIPVCVGTDTQRRGFSSQPTSYSQLMTSSSSAVGHHTSRGNNVLITCTAGDGGSIKGSGVNVGGFGSNATGSNFGNPAAGESSAVPTGHDDAGQSASLSDEESKVFEAEGGEHGVGNVAMHDPDVPEEEGHDLEREWKEIQSKIKAITGGGGDDSEMEGVGESSGGGDEAMGGGKLNAPAPRAMSRSDGEKSDSEDSSDDSSSSGGSESGVASETDSRSSKPRDTKVKSEAGAVDEREKGKKRKKSPIRAPGGGSREKTSRDRSAKRPKLCKDELRLRFFFEGARFFTIKSGNSENVSLSKARGVWATTPRNEAMLNRAFRETKNVILVFSVERSQAFQGFCRMASESSKDASPVSWVLPPGMPLRALGGVFKVHWINRNELPFMMTTHLTNPWNENRQVRIARDGTEIAPAVGRELCYLYALDEGIDLNRLTDKVKRLQETHPHAIGEKHRYSEMRPKTRPHEPRPADTGKYGTAPPTVQRRDRYYGGSNREAIPANGGYGGDYSNAADYGHMRAPAMPAAHYQPLPNYPQQPAYDYGRHAYAGFDQPAPPPAPSYIPPVHQPGPPGTAMNSNYRGYSHNSSYTGAPVRQERYDRKVQEFLYRTGSSGVPHPPPPGTGYAASGYQPAATYHRGEARDGSARRRAPTGSSSRRMRHGSSGSTVSDGGRRVGNHRSSSRRRDRSSGAVGGSSSGSRLGYPTGSIGGRIGAAYPGGSGNRPSDGGGSMMHRRPSRGSVSIRSKVGSSSMSNNRSGGAPLASSRRGAMAVGGYPYHSRR